jgi:amino-acid N-acetyltransferase
MEQLSLLLPKDCLLRLATAQDKWSIIQLVLSAKLDLTQLHWQQFWLVEWQGKLIACGQLRNFADAQELGSLVVKSKWRRQGIGSYLTIHLIQEANKPLYLECLGENLTSFYIRFGFEEVDWEKLPQSLQSKFRLSQIAKRYLHLPISFMQYQGT